MKYFISTYKNLDSIIIYILICIGKCQHLKIRKNVQRLTEAEKEDLTNALQRLIESRDPYKNFMDISNFHGGPYIICRSEDFPNGEMCCPHQPGSTDFFIWHRYYQSSKG